MTTAFFHCDMCCYRSIQILSLYSRRIEIPTIDDLETIDVSAIKSSLLIFGNNGRPELSESAAQTGTNLTDLNRSFLELSMSEAPSHETNKCKCRGMCKRKCPCLSAYTKCGSRCKCSKEKCQNKKEQATVQEKDFEDGTDTSSNSEDSDVELLSPLSELNSSSSDDESQVGRVKCQCKGKCQRKCPCKEANVFCSISLCACAKDKCMQQKEKHGPVRKTTAKSIDVKTIGQKQNIRSDAAYNQAKKQCELLERKEIIELLAGMAKFSPALWDQVKKSSHSQDGNDIGDENNTPVETPSWCKCGQCVEMPTQAERVCCQNNAKNHEHPLFENHCLTEHNLELAMQSNADHLNYPFDPSNNASWRYTAYRQYTIWVWGKLGRSNRKVIPSCIVHKIRKRFPDHNAVYTGFMDNEYYL
eukprot:gene1872-2115_t